MPFFLRTSAEAVRFSAMLLPAVRGADFDHHVEDRVPRLCLFELRIREHAAIPADVLHAAIGGAFEPDL